jgi:hypothetical protein
MSILFTFAVQYAVKTGKFTYNCITTMNFLTNFTITKFCLRLTIQKTIEISRLPENPRKENPHENWTLHDTMKSRNFPDALITF